MNWRIFLALFTVLFEVAHPFPTGEVAARGYNSKEKRAVLSIRPLARPTLRISILYYAIYSYSVCILTCVYSINCVSSLILKNVPEFNKLLNWETRLGT